MPKVGCVFPMSIWSEFGMGQYRDDDPQQDAPHFSKSKPPASVLLTLAWPNLVKLVAVEGGIAYLKCLNSLPECYQMSL